MQPQLLIPGMLQPLLVMLAANWGTSVAIVGKITVPNVATSATNQAILVATVKFDVLDCKARGVDQPGVPEEWGSIIPRVLATIKMPGEGSALQLVGVIPGVMNRVAISIEAMQAIVPHRAVFAGVPT